MTSLDDLIERVAEESDPDKCWNWPRKLDKAGRGRVWIGGKLLIAHRAVWMHVFKRKIPKGMLLCHHCDNPTCVNPAHLYVGTSADNARDMRDRGRAHYQRNPEAVWRLGRALGKSNTWFRGEQNPRAKLTRAQALVIRASPKSQRVLGREYGVSYRTIHAIKHREIWK